MIINGIIWSVKCVSPHDINLWSESAGTYALGCCDPVSRSIYINYILDKKKFYKVLCHEIAHAVLFSYNIELSYNQEELVADLIATYGTEIVDITKLLFKNIKIGRYY